MVIDVVSAIYGRLGLRPGRVYLLEPRSIPMTPGVSSLNLATAVAVVLYAWRFGRTHRAAG